MILPRFEFKAPVSIEEVCSALKEDPRKTKVIAGGTDILVNMKKKSVNPAMLISLDKVPQLREVSYSPGTGLTIGALVTMAELTSSRIVSEHYPALAKAAAILGTPQIRNRATIGGNICSARPAADTIGTLIGHKAEVELVSTEGERRIALQDFFTGPGETLLGPDEILKYLILQGFSSANNFQDILYLPAFDRKGSLGGGWLSRLSVLVQTL